MDESKVAVVTGGASGLGLASAVRFAGLGWKLAILDWDGDALSAAAEQLEKAPGLYLQQGDVGDADSVESFYNETAARLGIPDYALNTAGNTPLNVPTIEQPLDGWDSVVNSHFKGTYLSCRFHAKLALDAGRPASIVNVGSVAGMRALPKRSEYGPAKAAVIHLTTTLASEWSARGIRVNCIMPGYYRTPGVASLIERKLIDIDRIVSRVPMGRLGEPEEFAEVAEFLLSKGGFMTGACVPVDGGWLSYGE
jgi:NAD(P)-dependent dehydrogenase (short-subunit alcohol dehydrogenase family)